jgi:hypothetical protein
LKLILHLLGFSVPYKVTTASSIVNLSMFY